MLIADLFCKTTSYPFKSKQTHRRLAYLMAVASEWELNFAKAFRNLLLPDFEPRLQLLQSLSIDVGKVAHAPWPTVF